MWTASWTIAERVEIEKHLQANPQHRRLLEELRRTSVLLRGLPREVAPAELSEVFNAQLERSVLLHGIGEESSSNSMRIGRSPQFFAIAGIVLLTVGLAAVVFFALPSRNVHPTLASTIHPTTFPAVSAVNRDADGASKGRARTAPRTFREALSINHWPTFPQRPSLGARRVQSLSMMKPFGFASWPARRPPAPSPPRWTLTAQCVDATPAVDSNALVMLVQSGDVESHQSHASGVSDR